MMVQLENFELNCWKKRRFTEAESSNSQDF